MCRVGLNPTPNCSTRISLLWFIAEHLKTDKLFRTLAQRLLQPCETPTSFCKTKSHGTRKETNICPSGWRRSECALRQFMVFRTSWCPSCQQLAAASSTRSVKCPKKSHHVFIIYVLLNFCSRTCSLDVKFNSSLASYSLAGRQIFGLCRCWCFRMSASIDFLFVSESDGFRIVQVPINPTRLLCCAPMCALSFLCKKQWITCLHCGNSNATTQTTTFQGFHCIDSLGS